MEPIFICNGGCTQTPIYMYRGQYEDLKISLQAVEQKSSSASQHFYPFLISISFNFFFKVKPLQDSCFN